MFRFIISFLEFNQAAVLNQMDHQALLSFPEYLLDFFNLEEHFYLMFIWLQNLQYFFWFEDWYLLAYLSNLSINSYLKCSLQSMSQSQYFDLYDYFLLFKPLSLVTIFGFLLSLLPLCLDSFKQIWNWFYWH